MRRVHDLVKDLSQKLSRHISPNERTQVEMAIYDWIKRNFEVYGVERQYSEEMMKVSKLDMPKVLKHEAARILSSEIFNQCAVQSDRHLEPGEVQLETMGLSKYEPHFYQGRGSFKTMRVEILALRREPKK